MKDSRKIIFLTDYKNRFESKYNDSPYRSGMDKNIISSICHENEYDAVYIHARNIERIQQYDHSTPIVVTSIEEHDSEYRSFLIDIVQYLKDLGYTIIPGLELLKAHDNKVYMELLRNHFHVKGISKLKSYIFGNVEDLQIAIEHSEFNFPAVLKGAQGARSKNVHLIKDEKDAFRKALLVSGRKKIKNKLKDSLRTIRHRNYRKESISKNKFIIQEFIPELENDWKILIFGNRLFILNRGIKKSDFRASGQGVEYLSGSNSKFPEKYINTVYSFFKQLNSPYASLDVAIKDEKVFILEYQCVLFGKSTITMSQDFYELNQGQWIIQNTNLTQERILMDAIFIHIQQ